MALGPVPPPPTNPNPTSNPPKPPPDKPPDPLIAAPSNFFRMNFTEAILPRIPSNPYRGPIPEELRIAHRTSLQLAKEAVTKPFIFHPQKPLELIGQEAGASVSSDDLNAAVDLVIATLEVGYTPSRGPTLVSPEGWASLSCGLLAAVGRGYNYSLLPDRKPELESLRDEVPAGGGTPLRPDPHGLRRLVSSHPEGVRPKSGQGGLHRGRGDLAELEGRAN
ncbi:hypothetical protein BC826DRAFT_966921 [Russula brevipes]|nr:hypothetical protein BC826DRAFT_966921 [Russula brevipes]